ncbi:MAG: LysR family transcriptional regulator [Firmicutes bacterium]|nr:LysR family transcriptional regulator [Bacillota bacterium]
MKLQQLKYVIAVADTRSMNEAAKQLFIAQPSLSGSIKEIEKELGFEIFNRTNRGVEVTKEGAEFISYAKQVMEQVDNLERRFFSPETETSILSVSEQHYAFAVAAMIDFIEEQDMDSYDFSMRECQTSEVIDDVKNLRSEIGILSTNNFNEKVMMRFLKDNRMDYIPLFRSEPCVFLPRSHPLAGAKSLTLDQLKDYPYLCYQQKSTDSLYFSEEIMSTMDHRKRIVVNDRATIFNMLAGLNGYTIGTGMTCTRLNGKAIISVPLELDEQITIGYIKLKNTILSSQAKDYIDKLNKTVLEEIKQQKTLKIEFLK